MNEIVDAQLSAKSFTEESSRINIHTICEGSIWLLSSERRSNQDNGISLNVSGVGSWQAFFKIQSGRQGFSRIFYKFIDCSNFNKPHQTNRKSYGY